VTRAYVDGEVPIAYPTIVEQVSAFPGQSSEVVAVLVNGGINDVDIRNILNPFVSQMALSALIEEHCDDSMRQLLTLVLQRFTLSACPIIVTGYYPVLSQRSRPFGIPWLLANQGLTLPAGLDVRAGANLVVAKCMQFWHESTSALNRAVAAINVSLPQPRIIFADAGFTEANAIFADTPWLFGLSDDFAMSPQDEVVAERQNACDLAFPVSDWAARQQCYRASAGHPNALGARMYADAILAALGTV
jgi:lysophospholipase L1-like esterase